MRIHHQAWGLCCNVMITGTIASRFSPMAVMVDPPDQNVSTFTVTHALIHAEDP